MEDTERNGVGSVENAFMMLETLSKKRRAMALSEVARELNISPGKVHRYFVSLVHCGAVRQHAVTGKYELGPMSLAIGLSALGQIDAVRFASEGLEGLRDATDLSVLLAVWSDFGPVVIRSEESFDLTVTNVRVGSVVNVLTTAIGRVFLSFLSARQTQNIVKTERKKDKSYAAIDAKSIVASIKESGIARIDSFGLPNVAVMASPIFDSQGSISAVVAILGAKDSLSMATMGPGEQALRAFADAVTFRLGGNASSQRQR